MATGIPRSTQITGLNVSGHWNRMADWVQSVATSHMHDRTASGARAIRVSNLAPSGTMPSFRTSGITLAGQLDANAQNIISVGSITVNAGSTVSVSGAGGFIGTGTSTTAGGAAFRVSGDTVDRINIDSGGTIGFGPGNAARDIAQFRSSSGVLDIQGLAANSLTRYRIYPSGSPVGMTGSLHIYDTSDVTTNFERLAIEWDGGTLYMRQQVGGTGVLSAWLFSMGATEAFRITTTPDLQIADARNIILGTVTGTKIGTTTTQKLAFFNAAPVVQATGIVNADGTLADITTKFNSLLDKLEVYGLLAVA